MHMCEFRRDRVIHKFLSSNEDVVFSSLKYFEKEINGKFCSSECILRRSKCFFIKFIKCNVCFSTHLLFF